METMTKAPLIHRAPTRYYSRVVKISLWDSTLRLIRYGHWSRQKVEFDAVYKGDPRYEAAPFEERLIRL